MYFKPGFMVELTKTSLLFFQGIFLDLKEVQYIRRIKDESKAAVFGIQTADRQTAELPAYRLSTETEESMEDWVNKWIVGST